MSLIVPAIDARKRDVVMTLKAKVGQWVRLIAPGVTDAMAKKAVEGNQKYVEQK